MPRTRPARAGLADFLAAGFFATAFFTATFLTGFPAAFRFFAAIVASLLERQHQLAEILALEQFQECFRERIDAAFDHVLARLELARGDPLRHLHRPFLVALGVV